MRIITIPDLHGKDCWKRIDPTKYDKIVFLGDYVDSRLMVPPIMELNNLKEIIEFKMKFPEKIELILGNHDIQYLHFPKYQCSVNYHIVDQLIKIYNDYSGFFKIAYQEGSHLWSHAGVSKSWLEYYCEHFDWYAALNYNDLHLHLNSMAIDQMHILTTVSESRGGTSYYGGVFWADMSDTSGDRLLGIHQYVGHTKVPTWIKVGDSKSSIHYLDCLDTEVKFFEVEV